MDDKILKLKQLIKESNRIVFLTGAGVSKLSGIPDIRGQDGLAKRKENDIKYGATYEQIVSREYFIFNNKKFFNYYFNEMIYNVKPNITHKAIASLKDKAIVVTQNIDSLHSIAGSNKVIEVHGSVNRNTCVGCGKKFNLEEVLKLRNDDGVPHCDSCNAVIKPDVVLFNEPLNEEDLSEAIYEISHADLLIVIGSSLVVNPAASLPYYFNGKNFVIINKEETPLDYKASIIIREPVENFITFVCE